MDYKYFVNEADFINPLNETILVYKSCYVVPCKCGQYLIIVGRVNRVHLQAFLVDYKTPSDWLRNQVEVN